MKRSSLPSLFGEDKNAQSAFHSLHKEIDRVFDDFREWIPGFDSGQRLIKNGTIIPDLDVSETDDAVEVTAELPGVKQNDIDVSVSSNVLTLKGEKTFGKEQEDKDYRFVERSYGSFARSLPMDFEIDPEAVSATFSDGVLTITIQKPAEVASKSRKIEVSAAN